MSEEKYYKFGLRPIFSREYPKDVIRFYAFQWETGEFKEDMSYMGKINFDYHAESEELTKVEFETYVKQLKKEIK